MLRPFRAADFPRVWETHLVREQHGDPKARRRFRRHFQSWTTGRIEGGFLQLAIEVDGRLVGDIQARRPPRGLPPGVFELGISLYDTADRGRGLGRRAVELMTDRLFSEEGAGRVQASTDLGNVAMRRVLEKLGYVDEGVLRGFMPEGDGRADYAMYGITKEEWEARPRDS